MICLLFLSSVFQGGFYRLILLTSPLIAILTDTILTIFIRFKNGEKFLSKPHKQHAYQLLTLLGLKHWKMSLLYSFKLFIYTFWSYSSFSFGLNQFYYFSGIIIIILSDLFFISFIIKIAFNKKLLD